MAGPRSGVNVDHLCFVIEDADVGELAASGRFGEVGAPAQLFGARGVGTAIYVHDPDGNLVELRTYDS